MASNFVPSPPEIALVNALFSQADPQKLGVLTGEVAVKLFAGSHLPASTLGEIWNIADEDNNGWLGKKGVAIAIRLIGWAQKGEKVASALISKQGPLATIEGVTVVGQQSTGVSISRSPPPGLPALTPQDKARFASLFKNAGPVNGFLTAERARDTFMKSKLPNETLGKIWTLADTQDRGVLDIVDFSIGMYYIQAIMKGHVSGVPAVLPTSLYQQAGGNPLSAQITGGSGSFSPIMSSFAQNRPLVQQYTGQHSVQQHLSGSSQLKAPQLPARPPPPLSPPPPFPLGNGLSNQWDVAPAEKITADLWFAGLDHQNQGFIGGEVAVEFMRQSKLPDEILAKIWDLSDLNGDGKLTKEGFAVAMHLIQKKLVGIEVPDVLPSTLIPPSLRAASLPPAEHVQDLFSWDDAPSVPIPVTSISRQETGKPRSSSPPIIAGDSTGSGSFTGGNFLDDDDVASAAIHDHSAEIGNLRNQLSSTQQSFDLSKAERAGLEKAIENQSEELMTLQTQLATAKTAYETETKLLSTLRERHTNQGTEIQKLKGELIRAESDLSAMRVEKAEIEGAFLRDKEEARELHRKMVEAGQIAEALKAETEKAKKEAKQQRGLLAIARKQLSTKDADRVKATQELEEAQVGLAMLGVEQQELENRLAQSPDRPSPSALANVPELEPHPHIASLTKSNNPFERLAVDTGPSTPKPQSPFSVPFALLDDITSDNSSKNNPGPFDFDEAFATDNHVQTTSPLLHEASQFDDAVSTIDPDGTIPPSASSKAESRVLLDSTATQVLKPLTVNGSPPDSEQNPQPTDLGSDLKELSFDDSDSDSDDEVPLAELAKQKTSDSSNLFVLPDINPALDDPSATPPLPTHHSNELKDAFGIPTPSSALSSPQPRAIESVADQGNSDIAAGVNAFDEAMGKISNQAQDTPFETAFEDNFDFPNAAPASTDSAVLKWNQKPLDDAHSTLITIPLSSQASLPSASPTNLANTDQTIHPPNGQDVVVVGIPVTQQLDTTQQTTTTHNPPAAPALPIAPTPPKGSPNHIETRSSSPAPEKSSPNLPRTASPKPRPSTSSPSKDAHEKARDVPSRHSKLSIRLPFGKKKQKAPQEPLPPPQSHLSLSVPQEEAQPSSPALEDDVEAVKQLTGMGFSRSVAVAALETSGYDLQKALNSLL